MSKEIIVNSKKYGIKTIIVDDEDFSKINQHNWWVHKGKGKHTYYASSTIPNSWEKIKNGSKKMLLHRYLMGFPKDKMVDHINRNGLDNRKENLRLITPQGNRLNSRTRADNKLGIRGVYYNKSKNRYNVLLSASGCKRVYGGSFRSLVEATQKYNELAPIHHGEYAQLNAIPKEVIL